MSLPSNGKNGRKRQGLGQYFKMTCYNCFPLILENSNDNPLRLLIARRRRAKARKEKAKAEAKVDGLVLEEGTAKALAKAMLLSLLSLRKSQRILLPGTRSAGVSVLRTMAWRWTMTMMRMMTVLSCKHRKWKRIQNQLQMTLWMNLWSLVYQMNVRRLLSLRLQPGMILLTLDLFKLRCLWM